ncbi:haloacid dehalogenase superfamily, subfamily IA, variant 3 [Longilinea arvoryzae]|uniref:Haloacid dehalogenase superfamily, subfamily IA, variant 3 n=1 Tax=Longilinea arvoryzae TaxID=360412 RepID=A0A0S7BCJ4_9CHLR|nr:HAD-IA family hydrolase [Longilinea arvoryzae]GAP12921.1 haloacid dehalogenase superfamily, subfamily IA, variant 3 [Longilinea arvoryzae]
MSPNHSLKTILFDLDGTLINSLSAYVLSFQENIREYTGREISTAELKSRIGVPSPLILAQYAPEDQIPAMVERHNELMRVHSDHIIFYPGAREALRQLRGAGYRIGVVTSQIAGELETSRAALDVEDLVEVWVNSDMVAHPKPAADPILLALERLGEQPETTLMIGDSVNDVRAGQAAGTRTAAVTWGYGRPAALQACSPDLMLTQPGELAQIPEQAQALFAA